MMSRNATAIPRLSKAADASEMVLTFADAGRLIRAVVDLGKRNGEYHSLISFPALPLEFDGDAKRWLRMEATYRNGSAEDQTAFLIFLTAYRDQVAINEERPRFFAGPETLTINLPLDVNPAANEYQVTIYADRTLTGRLTIGRPRIVAGMTEYAIGAGTHLNRKIDLAKHWRQEGNRVICSSYLGEHWADMPDGWQLDSVHPAALEAAEWLIYARIEERYFGIKRRAPAPTVERPAGDVDLLSFSLGTDSTAAMTVMPDEVIKFYCKRPYNSYFLANGARASVPDHGLYENSLAKVPNLIEVPNTFEQARISAGQPHGYGHNFGYAAVGLLLADHLGAGSIAFGSVMEQVFLRSGHLYADVVKMPGSNYNSLRKLLRGAGLTLTLPTAGLSEVLTSRIAENGRYAGLAISCPRPRADGSACGTCFKCFRKLRLDGNPDVPPPDNSVLYALSKRPLKSATSVIYACQRSGFRDPVIDEYLGVDLGLLERYHDYALTNMLPEHLAEFARAEMARHGIEPMGADDEYRLRSLGRIFAPDEFDAARAGLTEG